jgi:hypothetical protein
MQILSHPLRRSDPHPQWCDQIFDAKSAAKGGIVRRSVVSVERELGRDRLMDEVKSRGFHLIECGDQFIIICNPGHMQVLV